MKLNEILESDFRKVSSATIFFKHHQDIGLPSAKLYTFTLAELGGAFLTKRVQRLELANKKVIQFVLQLNELLSELDYYTYNEPIPTEPYYSIFLEVTSSNQYTIDFQETIYKIWFANVSEYLKALNIIAKEILLKD